MMRVSTSLCALLIMLVAAVPAAAQNRTSAETRLQAAIHTELVEGDLPRAERLYRALAGDRGAGRGVVATALVNLGRTYEKMGQEQARAAYERVVREFGDQPEALAAARSRLQTLAAARPSGGTAASEATLRLILDDVYPYHSERFRQFDLSPDGERLVVSTFRTAVDTAAGRGIYVSDRTGTLVRRLSDATTRERFPDLPRWSPDGRYVAYVAGRPREAPDTTWVRGLTIIPVDGGTPHFFPLPNPGGGAVHELAWSHDSREISLFRPSGTQVMDLEGRTAREVNIRVPHFVRSGGYSPDGRWIVIDRRGWNGVERETDIFLVPATGGADIPVVTRPGADGMPAWGSDGRSIYYVSDQGGSMNVWRLAITPETGQPRGSPEQVTFYGEADVMFPVVRAGDSRIAFDLIPLTSAINIAPTSRPEERRAVARGRQPQLSPDGGTVYYMSEATGTPGIFAHPTSGGAPRRVTHLQPVPNYITPFALSGDGRDIALFSPVADSVVLYVVPTSGGAARRLAHVPARVELVPTWSPDGSRLAWAHGDGIWVIPVTGGEPRRIAQLWSWEGWTARWSPDGRWLAAFGYPEPGQQNSIYVVPSEGGEVRRLTPPEERFYKEGLEWHPDGTRLTYMYYRVNGNGDGSRVAYLDGRPTTELPRSPAPNWDYIGRWSPDGRRYYFNATPAGHNSWGLYVLNEAGGAITTVSPGTAGTASLPSFSRDGATMTWAIRPTRHQIWLRETSGSRR